MRFACERETPEDALSRLSTHSWGKQGRACAQVLDWFGGLESLFQALCKSLLDFSRRFAGRVSKDDKNKHVYFVILFSGPKLAGKVLETLI